MTVTLKAAVVGSRGWTDARLVNATLDALHTAEGIDLVVSGGAAGADTFGALWAEHHGVPLDIIRPTWRVNGVYNSRAGFERNVDIVKKADIVVAFWDGSSRGTADDIRLARQQGKRCIVVSPDGSTVEEA